MIKKYLILLQIFIGISVSSVTHAEDFLSFEQKEKFAEVLLSDQNELEFSEYVVLDTGKLITVIKHNGTCEGGLCFYFGFERDNEKARLVFVDRSGYLKFRKYYENGYPSFFTSRAMDLIYNVDEYHNYLLPNQEMYISKDDLFKFSFLDGNSFCTKMRMCLGKAISNEEYKKASEFIDYDINFSHNKVFATIHVMRGGGYIIRFTDTDIFYIEHLSSRILFESLDDSIRQNIINITF